MNLETILYYLFLATMALSMAQGLFIGVLYFFRRTGERRANCFYGMLLLTFGATLAHNLMVLTGFCERHPQWHFLPIYFTLAFPPLLFYHVKLSLYPSYRFKPTDFKHFILPLMQFIFFVVMFFTDVTWKSQVGRRFFNPFFGALEQALYLGTFFAYLYFAWRYVKQKTQRLSNCTEARLTAYLRQFIRFFLLLFCVHVVFVVADFVCYEFFFINLRIVKPYAALGALSFAALLVWLGIYGFQVLWWGRKLLR